MIGGGDPEKAGNITHFRFLPLDLHERPKPGLRAGDPWFAETHHRKSARLLILRKNLRSADCLFPLGDHVVRLRTR